MATVDVDFRKDPDRHSGTTHCSSSERETMPNHFLTVGLCGRDYNRLEAVGKEDYDEIDFEPLKGANLCELITKLPDELQGIVSSNPKCRYVHKATGEVSKDSNGPMGDDRDQWERVPLTDAEVAELVEKYGAADWYDWQGKNWGTKWGTYSLKVHELGGDGSPILIEFQTAWGPPTAEVMRGIDGYLCETYFLKNIKWFGHDPYDNNTIDIEIAAAVSV